MAEQISIEVAFALPEEQVVLPLTLAAGTTLVQAIVASGLAARYPDQQIADLRKGVWGKLQSDDYLLRDGDRVEIYRPLQQDPRAARRRRAARNRDR